jgi:hypothetical protein
VKRHAFEGGAAFLAIAAIGAAWFVWSLLLVTANSDEIRHGLFPDLHAVGISLPWAVLFAAVLLDEDHPMAARRLGLASLLLSSVLAVASILHHVWLDPELGQAFLRRNGGGFLTSVGRLRLHEGLLTLHGPLLAVASWYWLRSVERLPGRAPPRLAGAHAALPKGPARESGNRETRSASK